jgi:hypothetical protein
MTPGLSTTPHLAAIANHFAVGGEVTAIEPWGEGHINDSYRLTFTHAVRSERFLLQRINPHVFADARVMMENVARVTLHIAAKLRTSGASDLKRRALTFVPTRDGATCWQDQRGSFWRMCPFIAGARVRLTVENRDDAEQFGRAFGEFHGLLADLAPPPLHETLPGFHDTPRRLAALQHAIAADAYGRASAAQPEIDLALRHQAVAGMLVELQRSAAVPHRVVHNDAKISNVLFDESTGAALCVIDLDTVMPGTILFDFGDMVRSSVCLTAEDEPDLSRVAVQLPLFEALARGHLSTAGAFLTATEREHIVTAANVITLEQGIRFLTDFLEGDHYYKTTRPRQNLDRCRTQLKLLESLERNEPEMTRIVQAL